MTMTDHTHIQNIAVVGVGGHIGGVIAKALISQGKHKITAITRTESSATMPEGLYEVRKVDYNDHASLVEALKGQEVLIISLATTVPRGTQTKLIDAAKDAGVTWIMPNEYGGDFTNEQLGKDTMLGMDVLAVRHHIEEVGLKWIALSCGFWYEYSLAGSELRYGFTFPERKMTFFGDGNTKISTSTWPQCGRAVAALFALPISGADPCVSDWNNESLYIQSFDVSQNDMFASVLRVTGTKDSDWTVTHEDTKERFARGQKMFSEGDFKGFAILLYTRNFFPAQDGNFSNKVYNKVLGLPEEDLDEATKVVVETLEKQGRAGQVSE